MFCWNCPNVDCRILYAWYKTIIIDSPGHDHRVVGDDHDGNIPLLCNSKRILPGPSLPMNSSWYFASPTLLPTFNTTGKFSSIGVRTLLFREFYQHVSIASKHFSWKTKCTECAEIWYLSHCPWHTHVLPQTRVQYATIKPKGNRLMRYTKAFGYLHGNNRHIWGTIIFHKGYIRHFKA